MSNGSLRQFFFATIKPYALAGLRIGTGLVVILKMIGLTSWSAIQQMHVAFPAHTFGSEAAYRLTEGFVYSYPGLERLPIPSFAGFGMLETALLVVAIAWTIGYLTRITGPLLFGLFTYLFALTQFQFSYGGLLLVLTLLILAWAPTHRARSVDKLFMHVKTTVTTYRQRMVQFLVSAVYLFGVAGKLNSDWLRGNVLQALIDTVESVHLENFLHIAPSFQTVAYVAVIVPIAVGMMLRHRGLKRVALIIGLLFHLSLALLTDMRLFNVQMIVLYIAFFGLDRLTRGQPHNQQQQ